MPDHPKSEPISPRRYRPDIDGLRAIAVLLVVIYHALPVPGFNGFIGVDVFFVISGYLITGILLEDLRQWRFSLATFYVRRIRRILPALFAVCLAALAGAYLLFLPEDFSAFGESLYSSAVFAANFYFHDHVGYFDGPAEMRPLLHLWSLAVEEQFYIFWPPLLWLGYRIGGKRALLAGAFGLSLVSLVLSQIEAVSDPETAFYLLPSRAWELGAGALVALAADRLDAPARVATGLSGLGLALIAWSTVSPAVGATFPGLSAVPLIAGAALLIATGGVAGNVATRPLTTRPAVFVGRISYSLYLWHWPLLAFARYRLGADLPLAAGLAAIALAFALATLSWRLVEEPFRHGPLARRRGPAFALAAAGILAFVSIGYGMRITGGLWRYPPPIAAAVRQATAVQPFMHACNGPQNGLRHNARCNFGPKPYAGRFDVAIVGDSHANHFVPLAARFTRIHGLAGRQVSAGGCPMLFGVERSGETKIRQCRQHEANIHTFLRDNRPDTVFVAGRWTNYLPSRGNDSTLFVVNADGTRTPLASRAQLKDALMRTIGTIAASARHVVLIEQVPEFHLSPATCLIRKMIDHGDGTACRTVSKAYGKEAQVVDPLLDAVADKFANVDVLRPRALICPGGACDPVYKGTILYRDIDHLNDAGARALSKDLVERIPPGPLPSADPDRAARP